MKSLIDKLLGNKESPIGRDTKVERIGDYTVVRKIGAGGTSDVYLGLHTAKMATAAIKQLSLKRAAEAHHQMFVTESLLCGMLDHPNVISMHNASLSDPAGAYLVMEYVEGCSLDQHEDADTLLPVDTVVEVMLQAGRALQYLAAEGVIHRDLKPGNILMRKDGQIKLADFGCAIIQGQPAAALRVAGSLPYMSPEQISGEKLTHLADMYSLGAVFYRLLTGHHPVDAHTDETPQSYAERVMAEQHVSLARRRADLPPGLAAVVMRMLAREPGQRYVSWQAFLHKLQQAAAEGFREEPEMELRRSGAQQKRRHAKGEQDDYGLSFGW